MREALLVLVLPIAATIAILTVLHAGSLGRLPEPLPEWQVDAFADLGTDDQAIHSALIVASEDIGWINYDDGSWPDIQELQNYRIPPFLNDLFWEVHGELKWERLAAASVENGGATAYLGSEGLNPDQSAFALVFQHSHVGLMSSNQSEIWINKSATPQMPARYQKEALIAAGWRLVNVYSGANEADKIRSRS